MRFANSTLQNNDVCLTNNYEVLMQIKEDDSKVDICHCIDKQQSAAVMLTDEDDSSTVMVFSGHFTMDDVMKMTK